MVVSSATLSNGGDRLSLVEHLSVLDNSFIDRVVQVVVSYEKRGGCLLRSVCLLGGINLAYLKKNKA